MALDKNFIHRSAHHQFISADRDGSSASFVIDGGGGGSKIAASYRRGNISETDPQISLQSLKGSLRIASLLFQISILVGAMPADRCPVATAVSSQPPSISTSRTIDDCGIGFNCCIRFILVGVVQCHLLRRQPWSRSRSRSQAQARPIHHQHLQGMRCCTHAMPQCEIELKTPGTVAYTIGT